MSTAELYREIERLKTAKPGSAKEAIDTAVCMIELQSMLIHALENELMKYTTSKDSGGAVVWIKCN